MFTNNSALWYISNIVSTILIVTVIVTIATFALARLMRLNIQITKMNEPESENSTIYPEDWAALATGESGHIDFEKAWLRKFQELYHTFCMKQADYGPTNIGVGGLPGVTIRIGDKTSRLFELTGVSSGKGARKERVKGESVRDAFLDLADYGIIGVMVYDQDWPLVKPEEVWGAQRSKPKKLPETRL